MVAGGLTAGFSLSVDIIESKGEGAQNQDPGPGSQLCRKHTMVRYCLTLVYFQKVKQLMPPPRSQ